MENTKPFSWQESLSQTFDEFTTHIISYAPHIIGALMLLIVGWLVAVVLRIATRNVIRSLDVFLQRASKTDDLRQNKIRRSYALIASNTVFWAVMIFFIAAVANMLGWQLFTVWMTSVITYLPNLITGLLIILAGFLLSGVTRTGVLNTAHTAGIEHAETLARVVQIIIIFTAIVIGVKQIGINVDFLTNVLIVTIGVLLFGLALAFGLGAKTLVSNVIGAQYFRKHCRVGEHMAVKDIEGVVVEVTQTSIILDTDFGRTIIPAKNFLEESLNFKSANVDALQKPFSSAKEGKGI